MALSSWDSHGEEVHEVRYSPIYYLWLFIVFPRGKASPFKKMQSLTPVLTHLGTLALLWELWGLHNHQFGNLTEFQGFHKISHGEDLHEGDTNLLFLAQTVFEGQGGIRLPFLLNAMLQPTSHIFRHLSPAVRVDFEPCYKLGKTWT